MSVFPQLALKPEVRQHLHSVYTHHEVHTFILILLSVINEINQTVCLYDLVCVCVGGE